VGQWITKRATLQYERWVFVINIIILIFIIKVGYKLILSPVRKYIDTFLAFQNIRIFGFIFHHSVKGKLHPCSDTEVLYRLYGPLGGGSRGIALLFLDYNTRRE
jgi:hypothetical protein